ncbi:MAG: response regulator, partial [Lysobacteraceae bacterium]
PLSKIKVDRGFVSDVPQDHGRAAIVRAIIAMGRQLHLKVMAEGVETEAQVGYLRRADCDQLQGFLFSGPLPPEALEPLLRQRYLRPDLFAQGAASRTLLLVDDEENVLKALQRLLRRDGYRVLSASRVSDAFELLASNEVQVIVSDQRMNDVSGTEFLGRVKELYPRTVRLILSGYTDLATVTEAINKGAIDRFLTKPWDEEDLRHHIREAFRTWEGLQ